ncbi:uncharacterized protein KQ657_000078 [Scheffersomyces spartinae]|uniref:HMA domain-containing protein n=1 Tax=Scheffersomyces spartinae TaxID=45513 RepID=A0A9P8AKM0_9ASCO|nr:uncharacterized protein KQ657_000078 [Scheffersomyces spartinae]KAG7196067.1 hypothetical protein KQ657_000078 [Scheffersomyces spartinae]
MKKFTILLSNIHCSECETKVKSILSSFYDLVSINDNKVLAVDWNNGQMYVIFNDSRVELLVNDRSFLFKTKKIITALKRGGFIVESWEVTRNGIIETSSSFNPKLMKTKKALEGGFYDIVKFFQNVQDEKDQKRHRESCPTCKTNFNSKEGDDEKKSKKNKKDRPVSSLLEFDCASSTATLAEPENHYEAIFAVQGMTCSACSNSIMDKLGQIFGSEVKMKALAPKYSVNLIENTVMVMIENKQLINQITEGIEELGFDAQLIELLPVRTTIKTKVTAMIGGMTCAACSNSILAAVDELSFVYESAIDLVSKSGSFIIEDGPNHLNLLQTTVEDCGFEYELVSTENINFTLGEMKSRTVRITVEGMCCEECPELITDYLKSFGDAIVLEDEATLNNPIIKFTYIPGGEITVRSIIKDLNHLTLSKEGGFVVDYAQKAKFNCHLTSEETIDERLKKMSRRELHNILIRLSIASVLAIPTFIFGIVGMALLPKSNGFRKWTEHPIWAGNTSRNNWILLFLSTPVYFFAADIFHKKAIMEMKAIWWNNSSWKRRLFKFGSMNLLMSLGTSVAYFSSIVLLCLSSQQKKSPEGEMGSHTTYFDAVVFLTFFLLIGKVLESISKIKTAEAISTLSSLKKTTANMVTLKDGKYGDDEDINVKLLEIGDYVKISAGDSPPIDCVIVEGTSNFDESALTGESIPITRSPGHQIFTGTINTGGNVVIAKVLTLEGESLLDQIVKTVRDGQMKKAPIQRVADGITGYFVPIIVLLAVLTWIIWLILGLSNALPKSYLDIDTGGWSFWSLQFAIAVFVVACPCGIGLAAPTALFVGSGLACKHGILAKGGGASFQDGAKTNVVCFDKTGTLTYGETKITDYMLVMQKSLRRLEKVVTLMAIQLSRDLEVSSKHPLARAVKHFAEAKYHKLAANKVPEVTTLPGLGLRGKIVVDMTEGKTIWTECQPKEVILGNEKLMMEYNVEMTADVTNLLTQWKSEQKSVILLAVTCPKLFGDDMFHLIMCMACRDEVRKEAKDVIAYLTKNLNMECWMITGDNSLTAQAIGKELGIVNIVSEVLPSEKEAQIKKIQAKDPKNVVAMIGDGINDAPALSLADVGISLSSGADLAVNSSDFILLNKTHPLISIVTLFDLCQVVFRRVKFNFGWALIYNVIGVPIAAGVIYPFHNSRLDPVWASVAMALSSLSVVTSSLLLKLYRSKLRPSDFVRDEQSKVQVKGTIICV